MSELRALCGLCLGWFGCEIFRLIPFLTQTYQKRVRQGRPAGSFASVARLPLKSNRTTKAGLPYPLVASWSKRLRHFLKCPKSYLFKDASKDQIVRTIREVYSGEEQLPLAVAQRLAERLQRQNLTPREIEVL